MNIDETAELTMQVVGHAINGHSDQAAATLMLIGANSTDHEMYGVCCGFATLGVKALEQIYGKQHAGDWGLTELEPGSLTAHPAKTFSVRFLVAYANGDTDTCLALYLAALKADDHQYIESVTALVADVAGITRLALKGKQEGAR